MKPKILEWLERQKPLLVQKAEDYVKDQGIFEPASAKEVGKNKPKPRVTNSQLRNTLSVIQRERSRHILVNFLRYQIGRESRGWKHSESGEALIQLVNEDWTASCKLTLEPDERREVEASLLALLLGYIIREHTYRCKIKGTST